MTPRYFRTRADLRRWLAAHHRRRDELWVGFWKRASGRPSVTYPEALDEALCVGWIDGLRRRVDDDRYTIRFTPRKADSIWSQVNIRKAEALIASGRMKRPGLAAFDRRSAARQQRYSHENAPRTLAPAFERRFRANRAAWAFYAAQPPGYRRTSAFWVMIAVREATRDRRLETLVADSAAGRRIAQLANRRVGQGKK